VPADSVVETGTVEVEYIESEKLNDVEDIDTCLKVLFYSVFWVEGLDGFEKLIIIEIGVVQYLACFFFFFLVVYL
jgi:hypothetical protein